MKKLIFGDPKSIAITKDLKKYKKLKDLYKIVKCPYCGERNNGHFEFSEWTNRIGWDFKCCEWCPTMKNGGKLYTNLNGKFISKA